MIGSAPIKAPAAKHPPTLIKLRAGKNLQTHHQGVLLVALKQHAGQHKLAIDIDIVEDADDDQDRAQ